MCGACGEREHADWARALTAGLPARAAVATAITRLVARPGLKVAARPGGWVVLRPTGARTACASLTSLVAAVRPAAGAVPCGTPSALASGPLCVPAPDGRSGVRLLVRGGAASGRRRAPATVGAPAGYWTVPGEAEALAALSALATPPLSLRHYLAGIFGVAAAWGAHAGYRSGFDAPHHASDLIVGAEWARQSGAFDRVPFAARCLLDATSFLDLEIRAGHVVRAVRV